MTPTAPPILPRLLTPGEVASWLCLPERRVVRLARDGSIPHVLLPGGDIMFDPANLTGWLDGQRRPRPEGGPDAA